MLFSVAKVFSFSADPWQRRQYKPYPAFGYWKELVKFMGKLVLSHTSPQNQPSLEADACLIMNVQSLGFGSLLSGISRKRAAGGGVYCSLMMTAPSLMFPSLPPSSHSMTSGE